MNMEEMHIWYEGSYSQERNSVCMDDLYDAIKERLISELRIASPELMEYAEIVDVS